MLNIVLPHFSLSAALKQPEYQMGAWQRLRSFARFQAAPMSLLTLYQRYLALALSPNIIFASPVYQQMGMNTAELLDSRCLSIEKDEAEGYVQSLNRFYANEASFRLITPEIWQMTLPETFDFQVDSVFDAAGQTDALYRSEQAAHEKWLQLSTELQMWLHQHPLNLARQSRQQLPINAIWLWQASSNAPIVQTTALASNSAWKAFSSHQVMDLEHDFYTLQKACQENNIDINDLTLFSEDFVESGLKQDELAQHAIWQDWDARFLQPIEQNLHHIKSFNLITEEGCLIITKKSRFSLGAFFKKSS